eukprot:Hpha_TRINITY_DN6067_c0_g1::TRINITY_DN6067_c0_g1_i2::g.63352::m.63352/K08106/CHST15; N-acetylgalactosamine 4-sulfate 6-O-sulfotransferase
MPSRPVVGVVIVLAATLGALILGRLRRQAVEVIQDDARVDLKRVLLLRERALFIGDYEGAEAAAVARRNISVLLNGLRSAARAGDKDRAAKLKAEIAGAAAAVRLRRPPVTPPEQGQGPNPQRCDSCTDCTTALPEPAGACGLVCACTHKLISAGVFSRAEKIQSVAAARAEEGVVVLVSQDRQGAMGLLRLRRCGEKEAKEVVSTAYRDEGICLATEPWRARALNRVAKACGMHTIIIQETVGEVGTALPSALPPAQSAARGWQPGRTLHFSHGVTEVVTLGMEPDHKLPPPYSLGVFDSLAGQTDRRNEDIFSHPNGKTLVTPASATAFGTGFETKKVGGWEWTGGLVQCVLSYAKSTLSALQDELQLPKDHAAAFLARAAKLRAQIPTNLLLNVSTPPHPLQPSSPAGSTPFVNAPSVNRPQHHLVRRVDRQLADMLPARYEPQFRSPCWRQGGRLRCLPAFQVLGVSKCGTTDLFDKLRSLHLVGAATNKGPHWWDEDRVQNASYYLALYDKAAEGVEANPGMLTGEASSNTYTATGVMVRGQRQTPDLPNLPQLLAAAVPGARYVVMVREPRARYESAYFYYQRHSVQWRNSTAATPAGFATAVDRHVDIFHQCTTNNPNAPPESLPPPYHWAAPARRCARNVYNTPAQQLVKGLYALWWHDWQTTSPPLFVLMEEYSTDCVAQLRRVLTYLDLDPPNWASVCESSKKVNARAADFAGFVMPDESKAALSNFYDPFNRMLAQLLRRDKLWV